MKKSLLFAFLLLAIEMFLFATVRTVVAEEPVESQLAEKEIAKPVKLIRFEQNQPHMGVLFRIVLYAPDEETALPSFAAAFDRIHELNKGLSDYRDDSELSLLSATSGETVKLSDDLFTVLQRGQHWTAQSSGAFAVTLGPLTQLWRDTRKSESLPAECELLAAMKNSQPKNLKLDAEMRSAKLLSSSMRLDLGGIAKGYAADAALKALAKRGVTSALVDGSGDIAIGDAPPSTTGWLIAVAPLRKDAEATQFMRLANCGVATSGDAWQYVEIDGERYSHIVDPTTGLGLRHRSSVTVIAPNATDADALASAVSVLGPAKGIALVEKLAKSEAFIIQQTESDEGVANQTSGFKKSIESLDRESRR